MILSIAKARNHNRGTGPGPGLSGLGSPESRESWEVPCRVAATATMEPPEPPPM